MIKITYVTDPYCPWCYAGSKNVLRLYETFRDRIDFFLLPAMMLTHEYAYRYTPCQEARQLASLATITQKTGTPFGEAYRNVLRTEEAAWDSEPPCRALESVKAVAPDRAFAFADALLHARFHDGRDLSDENTFLDLCRALGIDVEAFRAAYRAPETAAAAEADFSLVDEYATVYPTLVADCDGRRHVLEEGFAPYDTLAATVEALLAGTPETPTPRERRGGCVGGVCSL